MNRLKFLKTFFDIVESDSAVSLIPLSQTPGVIDTGKFNITQQN